MGMQDDTISIGFGIDRLADAEKRLEELGVIYKKSEDQVGLYLHFHDPHSTALYFIETKTGIW